MAYQYVCGLMQAPRSNITQIAETVVNSSYERLQHFISHSPWSATAVEQQIAQDTVTAFATLKGETALLIDEFSVRKQGNASVGVARQYLGCEGKVENGQVAVLATLAREHYTGIVRTRLFLPDEWTDDRKRLDAAGVPEEARTFRTKPELAAEMIAALRSEGITFDFHNADALYGHSTSYRRTIDPLCPYIVFVHCNQTIYLCDPKPSVPERRSEKGPAPSLRKTSAFSQRVDEFAREPTRSAWQRITYHQGSKGAHTREVLTKQVWTWDGQEQAAVQERLVISRKVGGGDIQYSLSNDREGLLSPHRLLVRQMSRAKVERSIRDSKQELGMVQYQVRSWQAWEHHSALTLLALLFLTEERIANKRAAPLLSCADVRDILCRLLPSTNNDPKAIDRIIAERHERRARDIARWKAITSSA